MNVVEKVKTPAVAAARESGMDNNSLSPSL